MDLVWSTARSEKKEKRKKRIRKKVRKNQTQISPNLEENEKKGKKAILKRSKELMRKKDFILKEHIHVLFSADYSNKCKQNILIVNVVHAFNYNEIRFALWLHYYKK